MLQVFTITFIYLAGIVFAIELFDLRVHILENIYERILFLTLILLWPATIVIILVCLALVGIYHILRSP